MPQLCLLNPLVFRGNRSAGNACGAVAGRAGEASAYSSSGLSFESNGYARANGGFGEAVFSMMSRMATSLQMLASMDENNHPSSANLGVFIVMSIVPIVLYVVTVLVLPWVGRGFH